MATAVQVEGSKPVFVWPVDPSRIEETVTFRTLITTFETGREQRRSKGLPRRQWKVRIRRDQETAAQVWQFYLERRGPVEAFLWVHPVTGETVQVRFAEKLSRQAFWNRVFNIGIEFIEDKPGGLLPIGTVSSEKAVFDVPCDRSQIDEELISNAIISDFDVGPEHRRERGSIRRRWTLRFRKGQVDAETIWNFYVARKGSFESFLWTNPLDGRTYTVRFEQDNLTRTVLWRAVYETGLSLIEVVDE